MLTTRVPPDNATGKLTKVVQRVQVKIYIDDPDGVRDRLPPGLSVVMTPSCGALIRVYPRLIRAISRFAVCHAGTTPAEKCKTSGSLTKATKSQRDKSTAWARTTSLYVGRQVTFSPGADVMAAALTEGIHLVSTAQTYGS